MKLVYIYSVAEHITQINIFKMGLSNFYIPFIGIDNFNNYNTSSCRSKQKYGYSFDIKKSIKKLF